MNFLTALSASALATLLVVGAQARDTFPDIADWSTLKITLRRGGCYSCEAYRIEVSGNGAVEYEGYGTVAVRGLHRFRISESAVHELIAEFRRADFFGAPENNLRSGPGIVEAIPNDVFITSIGISFDGRSKEIVDYGGSERPVLDDVRVLEKLIDDAAGMSSWIEGNSQTLAKLEAGGWDFRIHADKHSMLFVTAAERGNSVLVRQLLHKNVAVRNVYGCAALRTAAEQGDLKTAALLAAARVPTSAPELDQADRYLPPCLPLAAAARHDNLKMLKLVLELHPEIDARGFKGKTPLIEAAENASGVDDEMHRDGATTVRLLLAAGARVNLRDDEGSSALSLCHEDAEVLRILLAAGAADVNSPDWNGRTPLMNSSNPEVTAVLLAAGADPYLKDKDGKTALDYAESWNGTGPILERWMAAHSQKQPN